MTNGKNCHLWRCKLMSLIFHKIFVTVLFLLHAKISSCIRTVISIIKCQKVQLNVYSKLDSSTIKSIDNLMHLTAECLFILQTFSFGKGMQIEECIRWAESWSAHNIFSALYLWNTFFWAIWNFTDSGLKTTTRFGNMLNMVYMGVFSFRCSSVASKQFTVMNYISPPHTQKEAVKWAKVWAYAHFTTGLGTFITSNKVVIIINFRTFCFPKYCDKHWCFTSWLFNSNINM